MVKMIVAALMSLLDLMIHLNLTKPASNRLLTWKTKPLNPVHCWNVQICENQSWSDLTDRLTVSFLSTLNEALCNVLSTIQIKLYFYSFRLFTDVWSLTTPGCVEVQLFGTQHKVTECKCGLTGPDRTHLNWTLYHSRCLCQLSENREGLWWEWAFMSVPVVQHWCSSRPVCMFGFHGNSVTDSCSGPVCLQVLVLGNKRDLTGALDEKELIERM